MPSRLVMFFSVLRQAPITTFLIAANIGFYFFSRIMDERGFESLSEESFLIEWGANVSALTLTGEYPRLLISVFQHVNFLHVFINMFVLWHIGRGLEPKIGKSCFLLLYLISGIAGALLSAIAYKDMFVISVGASGAILGLLGASIIFAIKKTKGFLFPQLAIDLVVIFSVGFFANVDNYAHLGGFLTGLLLSFIPIYMGLFDLKKYAVFRLSAITAILIIVVAFIYSSQNGELRKSLISAKLDHMLGAIGFKVGVLEIYRGQYSSTYMKNSEDAIYRVLVSIIPYKQRVRDPAIEYPSSLNEELRSQLTNLNGPYTKRSLREYINCMQVVEDAKNYFTAAKELILLNYIDQYCRIRQLSFKAVIGKNVEFSPQEYLDTAETIERVAQSNILEEMVSYKSERTEFIANKLSCPYVSCNRWD